MEEASKQSEPIKYFVNGESQTTQVHKLKVRDLLESAGFKPATDYHLTRDNGNHTFDNYDEELPIQKDEKFTATFAGPTPTSQKK